MLPSGINTPIKPGEPIRPWAESVQRHLDNINPSGEGFTDDTGFHALPTRKAVTTFILKEIVCNGPEDADDPDPRTDETYWLSDVAASGDPDDFPVTFADPAGSIVLATNIGEMDYHTHGLRVGTIVVAWQLSDGRWVFNQ